MGSIATLTKKTTEVSPAKQQHRLLLTVQKKKENGGQMCQPSERLRQAVHDQEETVLHRDAKAQKDHERRRCHHHLMEEGSENEDNKNSDEGRDIEEDDGDEGEGEGTQVGRPKIFSALH